MLLSERPDASASRDCSLRGRLGAVQAALGAVPGQAWARAAVGGRRLRRGPPSVFTASWLLVNLPAPSATKTNIRPICVVSHVTHLIKNSTTGLHATQEAAPQGRRQAWRAAASSAGRACPTHHGDLPCASGDFPPRSCGGLAVSLTQHPGRVRNHADSALAAWALQTPRDHLASAAGGAELRPMPAALRAGVVIPRPVTDGFEPSFPTGRRPRSGDCVSPEQRGGLVRRDLCSHLRAAASPGVSVTFESLSRSPPRDEPAQWGGSSSVTRSTVRAHGLALEKSGFRRHRDAEGHLHQRGPADRVLAVASGQAGRAGPHFSSSHCDEARLWVELPKGTSPPLRVFTPPRRGPVSGERVGPRGGGWGARPAVFGLPGDRGGGRVVSSAARRGESRSWMRRAVRLVRMWPD